MPAGPFGLAWGAVTYDEAVPKFGGLPAVHFAQHAGLVAQNETDTWTLFLVSCYDGAQTQFAGLFGWYGKDFGFRVVDTTGKSVNIGTGSAWTRVGDYLRVNKVQHTSLTTSNITVPNTAPYVLSCRLAGWQKTVASRVCRNALNGYLANNRGAVQWIAEVIAYDRALSDEEISDVESYLYDKWVAGGGVERNARVCNGTGGVALQGGAVISASAPVALNALSAELKRLDAAFRDIVAESPGKCLIFADRFPARYFVEEYGLDYFAAFPGCADDTEPSARTVAFLIDRVRAEKTPAVLYIEYSDQRMADVICEETGCAKRLFHTCHTVSAADLKAGASYLGLMWANTESIKEALG